MVCEGMKTDVRGEQVHKIKGTAKCLGWNKGDEGSIYR